MVWRCPEREGMGSKDKRVMEQESRGFHSKRLPVIKSLDQEKQVKRNSINCSKLIRKLALLKVVYRSSFFDKKHRIRLRGRASTM